MNSNVIEIYFLSFVHDQVAHEESEHVKFNTQKVCSYNASDDLFFFSLFSFCTTKNFFPCLKKMSDAFSRDTDNKSLRNVTEQVLALSLVPMDSGLSICPHCNLPMSFRKGSAT